MKSLYLKHIHSSETIENDFERLTHSTSILRSILQFAVVASLEVIKTRTPSNELEIAELVDRFLKPSDGLPIEMMDNMIPFIRSFVSKNFAFGWFEEVSGIEEKLCKSLKEWVEFRNLAAHGAIDQELASYWSYRTISLAKVCLQVFNGLFSGLTNGKPVSSSELGKLEFETPLIRNGEPIVILKIETKRGRWKLTGQTLNEAVDKFVIDLPEDNVFSFDGYGLTPEYKISDVEKNGKTHSILHNLPNRQTDIFEGRGTEIDELEEWMDDNDSRYCLVLGDGGYGKTTLVLEFMNNYLEGDHESIEFLPEIVSYHSSKLTRWTEEGLVHLKGVVPVMDECIRELIRAITPSLASEWYKCSGRSLINKAEGVLREQGFNRNDILLIIDNTETLASSSKEEKELGKFFQLIGRHIGRVIITSRRREFVPATPIPVEGLGEEHCIKLIKRLADEYGANPLVQAGQPKLARISEQLMYKPVLIETLVRYISHTGEGIDKAIEVVFKRSNDELIEFLYEDAWIRINDIQKRVFMVVTLVSSPLDQNTIGHICLLVKTSHSEFQEALNETHFANITSHGKAYTVSFVELAKRFFQKKYSEKLEAERNSILNISRRVDKYIDGRNRIALEYQKDRVSGAFRSEYAKAAKVYAKKNQIEEAIEMYDLALQDDPLNSQLHDRYAWLLYNRTNKFEDAKTIALKAIELDPQNCDALANLGLIYYRLGDLPNGDNYIDISQSNGRSLSFCLLRKGIARFHLSRSIESKNLEKSVSLLVDARDNLNLARKKLDLGDGYANCILRDITKYQDLTRKQITILRTRLTKELSKA